MVKAARGYTPQATAAPQDFGLNARLDDLEFELAQTRKQLADANAEQRRYDFREGVVDEQAYESADAVRTQATEMLSQLEASGTTSGSEFERLAQMAETGAAYQEPTLMSKLGGLIDIPARLLRSTVLDFTQLDKMLFDTEIDSSDNIKDIFLQRDASLMKRNKAFSDENANWSDSIFNMSKIMEGFGIPKADEFDIPLVPEWMEKGLRAGLQFGLELPTDPINWFTGGLGGAGRGTARAAGKAILSGAVGEAAEAALRTGLSDNLDSLGRKAFELFESGKHQIDDAVELAAKDGLDEIGQKTAREAAERQLREDIEREIEEEVMKPILNRDFGALPDYWKKSKLVKDQNPMLLGGIRPTLPLGTGVKGMGPIPLTAGAGRKITRTILGTRPGTEAAGFLGRVDEAGTGLARLLDRPANKWDEWMSGFSNTQHAWRAARRGDVDTANLIESGLPRAQTALGLRDVQQEIGARSNRLLSAMRGLDENELLETEVAFLDAVQRGAFNPSKTDDLAVELPQFLSDEQVEAVIDFGRNYDRIFRDYKNKAHKLGMDLGPHENYVPFVYHPKFEEALRTLADSGAAIDLDNLPEGLEVGLSWLTEALAATQRRGTKNMTSLVGESGHAQTRNLGREAKVTDLDGITIFNVSDLAQVQFASHSEMNAQLMDAVKWLAEKNRISIPNLESALELNPVQIMNRYTSSMGKALQERWLLREMRRVGTIRSATYRTDLARLAARHIEMASTAGENRAALARVGRIQDTLNEIDGALADPLSETKAVSLGPHGKVDLPARAVRSGDPRLNAAIDAAQRKSKAYNAAKTTHAREVESAVKRLTAKGVPESEARAIAESQGRRELKQAAARSRDIALEEAREEINDVLDAARRLEAEAAEWERVYKHALREAERAEKRIVRAAQKAQDKINKDVARQARKNAEGTFPRMRFDADEDAQALVDVLRADLGDRLDDFVFDIDDEAVEAAVEALKDALALGDNWDDIGQALNEFLNVGRKANQARPVISQAEAELLSGPVIEVMEDAYRLDIIGSHTMSKIREAGLLPGQEDESGRLLSDWVREVLDDASRRYGQMALAGAPKATLKRMDDFTTKLHRVAEIVDSRLEATPRLARVDQMLEGSALRGELDALRKLALGQKVMSNHQARQGLGRMLERAGMIGSEISLEAAPGSRFGFELVDRTGFELPPAATDLVDRAIADGMSARRANPELAFREQNAARAVMEARLTSTLRTKVLEPFAKKSSSLDELDTAYRAFKGLEPQLNEILAPLDRVNIDLVRQHLDKVIALKRAGDNPELMRIADSANNLRAIHFDPDTTMDSLAKLGRDVSRQILESDRAEQQAALALVEKMDETLRRILGLTRTDEGLIRRGFATPEEEELIADMLEQGKDAWRRLGLPEKDQPFHSVRTPTVELPNFVSVKGNLEGQIGKGEVVQIDAKKWLENTMAVQLAATTPDGIKELSKSMRALMKIWKAQATVARPTFHIRNFIGAYWNGMYADTGFKDYQLTFQNTERFLHALKRFDTPDEAISVLPEAVRRAYRNAWDDGIFDDSFASVEILSNRMRRQTKQRFNPLSNDGFVVRSGGRVMMSIESNMRMAVYMRHFNSYVAAGASEATASAAARSWVNMVHFDYSNLSQAEASAREIAPFFVWMRRNLPLQMRMITENPRFLGRYQDLLGAVDDNTDDMHADDLPNGLYRQGTAYANLGTVNGDTPFWARVLLDVDLPISLFDDVSMNPASWASMFANQLGPQFDVVRAFQEDDDYFVTAPGGISQLIDLIPFNLPGSEKNPYSAPRLSPKANAFWRLAFPALNELGGFALEQDPKRRANLGQDDLLGVDGDDAWMSDLKAGGWMLARGLGVQLESAGDVYGNTGKAQFNDLGRLKQELRRTGKLTPEGEKEADQANKMIELRKALEAMGATMPTQLPFDTGE